MLMNKNNLVTTDHVSEFWYICSCKRFWDIHRNVSEMVLGPKEVSFGCKKHSSV